MFDHEKFFVMSLFVKGRPIGMFYADSGYRKSPLDEVRYKRFKQLVALSKQQLERGWAF